MSNDITYKVSYYKESIQLNIEYIINIHNKGYFGEGWFNSTEYVIIGDTKITSYEQFKATLFLLS